MSVALALAIPSPPERHDELVRTRVAPVLRALLAGAAPPLAWFQRANKPDWGLRMLVVGDADRLDRDVRPALTGAFDLTAGEARFVEEPAHDKWTGGLDLAAPLGGYLLADTCAAIDALDADARGELGSRAQFSLAAIEGLLDAVALTGARRLAFYRESFEWAVENGRWDREVIDSLERTFDSQHATLALVADGGTSRWPSAAAARIGETLLDGVAAWARTADVTRPGLVAAAARGHSNRLGIHGGREGALRYLMWRARGGRALEPV